MLPNRFTSSQSTGMRKSRLEGKPSMLPLPRRPGSTDRLSTEARRPGTTGLRSSSAEPAKGTFANSRFSREASATKLPLNGRPRSQTGEPRYGQSVHTPLRTSHYSRSTTTPMKTPSKDREGRSWQTSLERALAFVTIKDQRAVSSAAWQRAESARVTEALTARGQAGALVRPLTIARFVSIVAGLLEPLVYDARLNNDNYVTKLPHVLKWLLYPGAVSKSWLRTVNTLHAFPHALALIGYLLDLVGDFEAPVSDEWLYADKDEVSRLRRDYIYRCWLRFQDPEYQFEDLTVEHLENLKSLLGNGDEKIADLQKVIKNYEMSLEDEEYVAAKASETSLQGRLEALAAALRSERAAHRATVADVLATRTALRDRTGDLAALDVEIERASATARQLAAELQSQQLTQEQRTALLDQVDYAHRVLDSKSALADQISKMVLNKETELALWQKKTLDSCVEYKQGLIHLSAQLPALARLAVDEKELMEAECAGVVSRAVEELKREAARLAELRASHVRERTALGRRRAALLEEARAKIAELKTAVQREQQALDSEVAKECAEASAWSTEESEILGRMEQLRAGQEEYCRVQAELDFWEKQDEAWRTRLSSMREYIEQQRAESRRLLTEAAERRAALLRDQVRKWNHALENTLQDA